MNSSSRHADAVEAHRRQQEDQAPRRSAGLCGEHHWILLPERWASRGTRHRGQSGARSGRPRQGGVRVRGPCACCSNALLPRAHQDRTANKRSLTVCAGIESSRKCPTLKEGTHVQSGWTDCKKFPLCRSRFVAKQLATSARDDVTQNTLALRLMIAMRAAGLLGANTCFLQSTTSLLRSFTHGWMRLSSCTLPRLISW